MKLFFEQPNSLFYFIPALILAGLIVWFTYKSKSQKEFYSRYQLLALSSLRFLALFILIILMAAPVIQWYHFKKLEPVIVIATDNSESMKEFKQISEELINKAKEELSGYKIDYWTFGEKAKPNLENDCSELRSDYGNLIREINSTYPPSSLSSLILIGDGIFNSGTDPVFESQELSFPVYTVGVGDSAKQLDAAILKVVTNPSAFLGDSFPVEMNLSYNELAGNDSKIAIWLQDELVYETQVQVQSNDFFQQAFTHLKADKSGILNYRVEISNYDKEINTQNNSYEFSIRVIDQKQKVLLLGHGSHPDLAAFIRVLDPQINIEYELQTGNYKQPDFSKYDLIIAHQLPDLDGANGPIIRDIAKSKLPVLWVLGLKTDVARLSNLQLGFSFANPSGIEFATGRINPQFNLFQLEGFWSNEMELWPPLQVPFAEIQLSGEWQTLSNQRIQQVDTQRPLICLGQNNGVKTGLIAGEGIWRWRIIDFARNRSNKVFDELVLKMINYLILKPNEDNFNLFFQSSYFEDEEVIFEAELQNESSEPVTEPEVSIHIKSDSNITYDYVFDKVTDHYQLNTGNLPAGSYSFEASTRLGDQTFTESGSFRVDKLQLEQIDIQANFNLLYQISASTGGKFIDQKQFQYLIQQIRKESDLRINRVRQLIFKELIAMKWMAFLILILISMEWFLRKYWGSY